MHVLLVAHSHSSILVDVPVTHNSSSPIALFFCLFDKFVLSEAPRTRSSRMMTMMRIVVVVVVALVEFPAVRMPDVVTTLAFLGSRRHVGKIGLLGPEQVAEFGRFLLSLVERDGRRRRIANGSLAAVAGQARPLGWGKGIAILFEELLVLALPRIYFCAEGVAHLVAGGDGGDFFPHALPKL